jgi:hypothetical protein
MTASVAINLLCPDKLLSFAAKPGSPSFGALRSCADEPSGFAATEGSNVAKDKPRLLLTGGDDENDAALAAIEMARPVDERGQEDRDEGEHQAFASRLPTTSQASVNPQRPIVAPGALFEGRRTQRRAGRRCPLPAAGRTHVYAIEPARIIRHDGAAAVEPVRIDSRYQCRRNEHQ